ncbi:hypothetical protein [Streptomyces sp. NRRL F-5630]|uniref:hypothetical protein n=1 Tax=Streptomyces sp. NRRL F-5630 TaxID=1463864 RepID=UPI0004C6C619|nr:hypothetical protein [Streptomyces sp. NRRL F-5630]
MFGRKTPTVEEQREALSLVLLEAREHLEPILDAADGLKADLLARGRSPAVVDHIAGTWLASALKAAVGG